MLQLRNWYFNLEDVSQIAIGSFALTVPISFSEEAWRLGETLAALNLVIIFVLSVGFLSFLPMKAYSSQTLKGDILYFCSA